MKIEQLLKEMIVEEKAALVSGTDFMYTNSVPRLCIPSICLSDGPHGLRKQIGEGDNGVSKSEPATAFPTAVTTASGWNTENTYRMGEAIAEECKYYDVNVLLGPGANIKRNPRAGRNFEYFSEDPLLAGKMAAAEVNGVQSQGVGVSVKHFALNNAEDYRFMGNSVCDMRTMREIYLKVFEYIVKESKPYTLMGAYNKINGEYCSQNGWLLNDVLRGEWGFDGIVMTDWGAMHDRVKSLKSGLDLEMPGDCAICRKWIVDGIADGTLAMEDLDRAAENILNLIDRVTIKEKSNAVDFTAHHELAAEIAEDCAVLLKNDGSLPLRKDERLLVVGDLFDKMRYQGAGSSMINPMKVTTPRNAFDKCGVAYEFAKGYSENRLEPQNDLIAEAVNKTNGYDKVIIFAGLTDYVESEGGDRENLNLPQNQIALIDALIKTGKKIIVVLYGGSVIELPFADKVNAILNMFLPGQNGGTATYNLLFGNKTPCGKLSETWVKSYADVPFGSDFSKNLQEVYKESVFVGYRYYLTANKQVRYPFGYGLSYTTFDYSNLQVKQENGKITVTCAITNTGSYEGAEVVQLYVKAPKTQVFKPEKELRAFSKVYLKAGESKTVTLDLNESDLRYFNIKLDRWVLESGEYELQICSDCQTIKLSERITVQGENEQSPYSEKTKAVYSNANLTDVTDDIWQQMSGLKIPALPPKKPITLDSRFSDLKQSKLLGKIIYNAVLNVAKKQEKQASKMSVGNEKDNAIKGAMFLKRILDSNSIMSMTMCAGLTCPYNFAQGFVHFANGRLFKGIKCFCTKIKAPILPKDKTDKEEK